MMILRPEINYLKPTQSFGSTRPAETNNQLTTKHIDIKNSNWPVKMVLIT
jgi:hypothetical protein